MPRLRRIPARGKRNAGRDAHFLYYVLPLFLRGIGGVKWTGMRRLQDEPVTPAVSAVCRGDAEGKGRGSNNRHSGTDTIKIIEAETQEQKEQYEHADDKDARLFVLLDLFVYVHPT